MSDETKPPGETGEVDGPGDPIARLIRLSGSRPPVPEDRMARVRDAVHLRWSESVKRDRYRRLVIVIAAQVATAASLALIVGYGLRWWDRKPAPDDSTAEIVRTEGEVRLSDGALLSAGGRIAPGAQLTTGPGGRAAMSLSAGPAVRLDSETDVRLISDSILELLRGAVYVDTGSAFPQAAAANAHGIEIRTRLGRVRDIGTRFEVRLADDRLRVSVREGVAALARDDRTYTAPAGTRLRVDSSGAVETGTVEPLGTDWDWIQSITPPFDLEGRTLSAYLDWLSRETGWSVTYAEPSIARSAPGIIMHGTTSGLRPDETAAAVLPTCGLSHRLEGTTLIIESAPGEGAGR